MKFDLVVLSLIFTVNFFQLGSLPHEISSKKVTNSIQGQVFDPFNRPVPDLYIELQNELSMTISRQRTLAGGRFQFNINATGSFKVKVLTTGTNYLEQTQEVSLVSVGLGSDTVYLDFHLKFDPRKIATEEVGINEAVFVQEGIPATAQKFYNEGVKLLSEKNEAGLDKLEQAIRLSPDYFAALTKLGEEYVRRKKYVESLPFLVKAIDVNQRSFSSFFNLAFACYQLNQKDEAVKAGKAAVFLKPNSIAALLLYGTILRSYGYYAEAEDALIKAEKLGKPFQIAEIHWQLALLYNRTGRNKKAVVELEEFLKIEPNSPNKKEIQELIQKLKNK